MTKQQYKIWAKQFFKQTSPKAGELFFEMIELADNLKRSRILLNHHLESSFNSKDRLNLIKATHIFRYPAFLGEKSARDFINWKMLISYLKELNKNFKAKFNFEALNFLLSVPLAQGGKNDGLAFNTDFICSKNHFNKISFYMRPSKIEWISEIAQFLKIKKPEIILSKIENLEFLGVDFLATGKCYLKFYQEINSLPESLEEQLKMMFSQVDKLKSIKTMLLMTKFGGDTSVLTKDIYFYCENLDSQQILELPCLKSYRDFLKQIRPYLNNFKIIWLVPKDKKLEIYFR
ncbi:hypothetical protein KJA17_01000 [Patescibacteria group bacterium]|nr:hypothetical protein [Patescibacteria group bacterium]